VGGSGPASAGPLDLGSLPRPLLSLAVAAVGTVIGLGLFLILGVPLLGLAGGGGMPLAVLARRRSGRAATAVEASSMAAAVAMPAPDDVLDPAASTGHRAPITFAAAPARGVDRCRIGSRLVPLRSEPGELMGVLVGRLDVGDEVDVLRQEGTNCLVRTPSGAEGWVPGMALLSAGPVAPASVSAPVAETTAPSTASSAPVIEASAAEPEAPAAPPSSPEAVEATDQTITERPRKAPARSSRPASRRRNAPGGTA
jgi:hypothetical protein